MKPRVKCRNVSLQDYGEGRIVAHLYRMSDHPKLGPAACESSTRTSLVLNVNREEKYLETLNTIYHWDDNSLPNSVA